MYSSRVSINREIATMTMEPDGPSGLDDHIAARVEAFSALALALPEVKDKDARELIKEML